jgi:hypothetical protein
MRIALLGSFLFAALTGGCVATGSGSATYSAEVSPPPMVYIDAEVQVIENYPEPVFYSSNYYWRYDSGAWYRSQNHTRGWARVEVVPVQIRRIEHPSVYVRYRGNARANTNARQDVRQERREEQQERKEERREDRQDAKDDRRDAKDDRRDAKDDRKDNRNNGNNGNRKR